MRLIIDNRERDLIERCTTLVENDPNYTTIETAVLSIGDIHVKTDEGKDVMLIERKTLQDLLASIKDGRYEEQSHRLKYASGFDSHNVVYLIEGMFSSLRTPLEKKLVISAITSLSYFKGFSVLRTSGLNESADVLVQMADKIDRNFMKGVLPWYLAKKPQVTIQEPVENVFVEPTADETTVQTPESYATFVKKVKKENITPENMGEILLCQIPGISAIYAQAILKHFGGFSKMMAKIQEPETLKEFENIQYEVKGKMRRIPKTCGTEIARLL